MRVPVELIWGCSGRVIAAHLPERELASALQAAGPSPVLGTSPPKRKAFASDLAAIREHGWDFTRGEKIPESVGLAAPVFTARGVIGSLSLTIPAARFAEDRRTRLGELLAEHAGRLSTALGTSPPAVAVGSSAHA